MFLVLQSESECAYYLRTGQCKFGGTCKFDHPQPTNMMVSMRGSPAYPSVQSPTTPGGQQSYFGGITNWSRGSFIASPRWQGSSNYAPMILPQGVVSVPSWNAYSVSFALTPFFSLETLLWKYQIGQTKMRLVLNLKKLESSSLFIMGHYFARCC